MIPFEPQTLLDLQQRYPAALTAVHDVESIKLRTALPPSSFPANRFDSAMGLRLFVSRERLESGQIVLHLSASVQPGSALSDKLKGMRGGWEEFLSAALDLFRQISGDQRTAHLVLVSQRYVPHWWIWE